jgi:ribosomal protein S18 acetylase RimI-like enzyme
MELSPDPICRLSWQHVPQAAETLSQAFENDVIKMALIQSFDVRARFTRWIFKGTTRYCMRYGEVHISPGVEGVACWLPPGRTSMSGWGMVTCWDLLPNPLMLAGRKTLKTFFYLQELMEKLHKRLMPDPHWYLLALGVKPEFQGQGIGGRLLAPMLARLDREGALAYLETQTEQNVTFYQRRGFHVVETVDWQGLAIWLMARKPK